MRRPTSAVTAIPLETATMPSSSVRAKMYASPAALPERVAESRGRVVVERRERARGEACEEVCDGGRKDPCQRLGARVARDLG